MPEEDTHTRRVENPDTTAAVGSHRVCVQWLARQRMMTAATTCIALGVIGAAGAVLAVPPLFGIQIIHARRQQHPSVASFSLAVVMVVLLVIRGKVIGHFRPTEQLDEQWAIRRRQLVRCFLALVVVVPLSVYFIAIPDSWALVSSLVGALIGGAALWVWLDHEHDEHRTDVGARTRVIVEAQPNNELPSVEPSNDGRAGLARDADSSSWRPLVSNVNSTVVAIALITGVLLVAVGYGEPFTQRPIYAVGSGHTSTTRSADAGGARAPVTTSITPMGRDATGAESPGGQSSPGGRHDGSDCRTWPGEGIERTHPDVAGHMKDAGLRAAADWECLSGNARAEGEDGCFTQEYTSGQAKFAGTSFAAGVAGDFYLSAFKEAGVALCSGNPIAVVTDRIDLPDHRRDLQGTVNDHGVFQRLFGRTDKQRAPIEIPTRLLYAYQLAVERLRVALVPIARPVALPDGHIVEDMMEPNGQSIMIAEQSGTASLTVARLYALATGTEADVPPAFRVP
jgi:hypothetical protein